MMATPTPSTEPLRPMTPPMPSQPTALLQVPGQHDGSNADTALPLPDNASQTGTGGGSAAPSIRPPSAIYANTQIVFQDADFTHPPDLNYSLRPRKKAIWIFWTLIILDCVAMPIALYFGLWYGTGLSPNAGRLLDTSYKGQFN